MFAMPEIRGLRQYAASGSADTVLRVTADHWLDTVGAKAASLSAQVMVGASLADRFTAL